MFITVMFIEILNTLRWINLPPYTWRSASSFLIPSLGYATNASLALMALEGKLYIIYNCFSSPYTSDKLYIIVLVLHILEINYI